MKRLVAALLYLFVGAADAETVVVRSGEHENFSRLVLTLASPNPWQLGKSANGYILELDRKDVMLDLGDVYRLIPRSRLAELTYDAETGQLKLKVACDCHATAFAPNDTSIAIDILDGPAPIGSSFDKAVDVEAPSKPDASATAGLRAMAASDTDTQNDPMLDFFWRGNAATSAMPIVLNEESQQAEGPEPGPPAGLEPSPGLYPSPTTTLKDDLLEQFARAATQGLVTPAQDHLFSATEIVAAASPPLPENPMPAEVSAPKMTQIRIRSDTAIDRDMGASTPSNETRGGNACLSDDALDLNGWGQAEQAADQIGAMNRALVGEFDMPDPLIVVALSRYYLMLGWGAEAQAIIREFPIAQSDDAVLLAIADIMDHGATENQTLTGMESCPGNAALWSVLSRPTLAQGTDVNRSAVLGAFSKLPLHLRRHLLLEITGRFLASGDPDTAQALRDTVSRAAGNHGIPLKIVEAELGLQTGDKAQAATLLADIVAADSEGSPDALVKLIELRVGQGERIDFGTVAAVDALAYEHRGTGLGARLSTAHVQAAAGNGALDAAFAAWDRLDPTKLSEADEARIADAIGRGMIAEPDAATFLRLSLAHAAKLLPAPMTSQFRTGLAARLLDLGFPNEARAFLLGKGVDTGDLVVTHLLARSYLANGDAAAAIQTLRNHDDEKSLELHAQALASLGDNRGAAELISQADMPETRASYDWRAGNWDAVMQQGEGPRPAAAALVAEPDRRPPVTFPESTGTEDTVGADETANTGDPGPLAHASALIEESEKARATVRALLESSKLGE